MKSLLIKYLALTMLFLSMNIYAQSLSSDEEILAQRGNGVVTQVDFTARADKIPAKSRHAALRDTGRLRDVLNTLLLRAQMAADAREAGYDQEAVVKDRMRLAADAELGQAWLQHYVEIQPEGDYEQLAREYYQLNKQEILTSEQIDVSHILVSTDSRTIEEARELADSISQKIELNPELFDELVTTYSEDPSASSNHGRFFRIKKGGMVDSFEDAAYSMTKGEISKPVKTIYGFHIIRLDEYYEPKEMSFDEVKSGLIDRERERHQERLKQQYLGSLTSLDVQMSKEALEEMVNRQLGEDYVESPDNGADS